MGKARTRHQNSLQPCEHFQDCQSDVAKAPNGRRIQSETNELRKTIGVARYYAIIAPTPSLLQARLPICLAPAELSKWRIKIGKSRPPRSTGNQRQFSAEHVEYPHRVTRHRYIGNYPAQSPCI